MKQCLDVVRSDIAGPVEVVSRTGARYVLLFVDGFSRYCHIFLLRERFEFFDHFIEYQALVERHHNRGLQRFVSDNGGEYLDER